MGGVALDESARKFRRSSGGKSPASSMSGSRRFPKFKMHIVVRNAVKGKTMEPQAIKFFVTRKGVRLDDYEGSPGVSKD
jgi:hypothetical protein